MFAPDEARKAHLAHLAAKCLRTLGLMRDAQCLVLNDLCYQPCKSCLYGEPCDPQTRPTSNCTGPCKFGDAFLRILCLAIFD